MKEQIAALLSSGMRPDTIARALAIDLASVLSVSQTPTAPPESFEAPQLPHRAVGWVDAQKTLRTAPRRLY
jgi:hypothetical protein